jgi:hypothetical protein
VVADCHGIPDDHPSQDFDTLRGREAGTHGGPESALERTEHPFDHRPSSIPTAELASMAELVDHHRLPRRSAVRRGRGANVPAEGDHGSPSAVRDPLGVLPPLIAAVEHYIAEGDPSGHLVEEDRELCDIVGVSIRHVGGPEEREVGVGRHQGMEFDKQVADPGVASDEQPSLEPGDREPGAVTGEMERLPLATTGQSGDEALEIGRVQTRHQCGDRGSGGESVKAELSTEVGTGRERGVGLVIRPTFESSKEKETNHIAGVGGRSTGSVGRTNRVGRGESSDRATEDAEERGPSLTEEAAVAGPVDPSESVLGRRWVFRSVGWWRRSGRKAPSAVVGVHNQTVAEAPSWSNASTRSSLPSEGFQSTSTAQKTSWTESRGGERNP